jgi:PPOX class probable F420-dependent enzyme
MLTIDENSEFGKRVLKRLEEEVIIWLTTVSESAVPHPRPVWFYWDGETFHIYSQPETYKLQHMESYPDVSLNFDSDGEGGDIVVFLGKAEIREDLPPADEDEPYIEKYEQAMEDMGTPPDIFAKSYSVPIRVAPTKLRGH